MSTTLRKIALAGVAISVIGAAAAEAAPMRATAPSAIGFDQGSGGISADHVQYYRRRYYRRGYGAGPAIAAGAAIGLLGAGIAAAAAPSYGYGYGYPAYGGYGYGYPAYGGGYGYPGYGYYGW